MNKTQAASGVCILSLLMLMGCQSQLIPQLPTVFSADATPRMLFEPAMMDWASQRITSPAIIQRRSDYQRKVQLTAPAGWSTASPSAHPGIRLDTLPSVGASLANDWVPNGPACTYFTSGSPASVRNKIFFLTRNGKLVRVAQDKSSAVACDLNVTTDTTGAVAGQTFSRTYVTLSPSGGRSYVLSDQGSFYVVNNDTMKATRVAGLGGTNTGLAPVLDPTLSSPSDGEDVVYVPVSTGVVTRYTVTPGAPGGLPAATQTGSFDVGGTLEATPIVLNGNLYGGDASGNLFRFNANTNALVNIISCGYPIRSTPTLNLDASGNVTDAFANAGTSCVWVRYDAAGAIVERTFSRPLFIDELDSKKSASLSDWVYSAASTKYWVPAKQGITLNKEDPAVDLPPGSPASYSPLDYKTNGYLSYAETGTRGTDAAPEGGPVVSYIRWDTSDSRLPSAAVVSSVKVWVKARDSQGWKLRPPTIRKTSPSISGQHWSMTAGGGAAELTNLNAPSHTAGTAALEFEVPLNPQGRINYQDNKWYGWNFTSPSVYAGANFAVTLFDESNDDVFWKDGPVTSVNTNSGNPAKTRVWGPRYWFTAAMADYLGSTTDTTVNSANGSPASAAGPVITTYETPLLELTAAGKQQPSVSIETPPIVDVTNGRRMVYVLNSNAIYGISFANTDAWADVAGGNTIVNVLYSGDKDQTDRYPTYPATGADANTICVEHRTAPLLDFTGDNLYLLDRYPTAGGTSPTSYAHALNRIRLPLQASPTTRKAYESANNGASVILRPQDADSTAARDASAYMVMDFFTNNTSGSRVYLGLPTTTTAAGYIYQLAP